MPRGGYASCLVASQGDGTALASSTTPTSILPGQAKFQISGSSLLEYVGQTLRFISAGRMTTRGTGGDTITFDLRIGSVIVATSQALAVTATALTNTTYRIEWDLTLRATGNGTSANFMHIGKWESRAVVGAGAVGSTGVGVLLIPETAPVVGTGFDMTQTANFDHFATWSFNSASNSVQCHIAQLWLIN